ncbi:MAG TPA: KEOPS complex subunit Pcc1 [Candidatus Bilamarchaeum sp.]|nr:KEOPS complex subunit Pcc1 [Candidatus Bilamarchaeum sp.]
MKARCRMEVEFPDSASAKAAVDGLSHEKDIGERSRTEYARDGPKVLVTIESDDVIAMRAAANACMRALSVFEQLEKEE